MMTVSLRPSASARALSGSLDVTTKKWWTGVGGPHSRSPRMESPEIKPRCAARDILQGFDGASVRPTPMNSAARSADRATNEGFTESDFVPLGPPAGFEPARLVRGNHCSFP